MARKRVLRPRTLGLIFGGYVVLIAIIAWYFATGAGSNYVYGPDMTRWAYTAYMLSAAALLSGIAVVAVGSTRHLDRLMEDAETGRSQMHSERMAPVETYESDALPPPLKEAPVGRDHVDQDIDDLLVSLQDIEASAGEQAEEFVMEESPVAAPMHPVPAAMDWRAAGNLEKWKRRRAEIPSYFAGPAILAIAVLAICAAMLPGADAMLQTNHQLNTALILGIGYAYGGIGAYAAASVYAILR